MKLEATTFSSAGKHGPHIGAGLMTADETRRIRAIRLQHIARRSLIDELFRFIDIREFENGGRGQAEFGENALGIGAVIFKTSTIGAAANNIQSFAPQTVLDLPVP